MNLHLKTLAVTAAAFLVFGAGPVRAGLMDWWKATTQRGVVPPDKAQNQVKRYLERVLKREDFKVSQGRSILAAADRKTLDGHVVSRLDRFPEMAVADVTSRGTTGLAVLAGHGLAKGGWDPAKGYVAYVSLAVEAPFPVEADRALELTAQLVGEPAMFGFSVEAGPLWKESENYLVGALSGAEGAAQFAGGDAASDEGHGSGHDLDDIPAWVVRGWTELVWKGCPKPLEMGTLFALTRERNPKRCRLMHVTGVGNVAKGLFTGAIRLNKEDEEE